jgi:integrase
MGTGKQRRYVKFNKKRVYADGTIFCLRYGRKFETLQVSHQGAALRRRAEKEAELLNTPVVSADASAAQHIFLKDAVEKYLIDVSITRKWRSYLTYKKALTDFQSSCSKHYLDELTKDDLTNFAVALKLGGRLSDVSIDNHLTNVGTFLHKNNLELSLHYAYTEKKVKAYSVEELRDLNATSTDEELQVWQFFLHSGFRDDEVAHACFSDIDFKACTISVLKKPQFDWEPKDKEERTVPVSDSLIDLLKVRQSVLGGSWLIFPNHGGNPQGHFLRMLKERALSAGLNCGHCQSVRKGQPVSCRDEACCENWKLHKFRKSFATLHHQNGVSARTIQGWLGHSDLETTLRYLADAELNCEKTRSQVNGSFAEVGRE